MRNDELKKLCNDEIHAPGWHSDRSLQIACALLQRLEAEEAKTVDAEAAFKKWHSELPESTKDLIAFGEVRYAWLACYDWMKRSTNAPVGVPEGHILVRIEPLDSMVPDYAHAGFAKQIYRDMIALSPKTPNSGSPSPSGETK